MPPHPLSGLRPRKILPILYILKVGQATESGLVLLSCNDQVDGCCVLPVTRFWQNRASQAHIIRPLYGVQFMNARARESPGLD